jgi:sterol desaturase/sphingolipid hydroxylase (fatty acid hydroxylase superfamily)
VPASVSRVTQRRTIGLGVKQECSRRAALRLHAIAPPSSEEILCAAPNDSPRVLKKANGLIPVFEQASTTVLALYADLGQLLRSMSGYPLVLSLWNGLKVLSALFVVIFLLELVTGGNVRRYWTRNFRTDLLYGVFYYGGIYNVLIYAPLAAAMTLFLPAWNFRLLEYLPGPVAFVLYWVAADAAGYWIHRWQHHNPILWELHKVHHAQTEMTFVTSFRNHALEQVISNVILFIPLMILGLPLWYWAPVYLLQVGFESVQHADLKFRYGRLYPVLVSPVFHAIHHSPERARHDSNYGKILSVWDYLFGTISVGERPARYGLIGVDMPVSFWGTMAEPFVALWQKRNILFASDRPRSA